MRNKQALLIALVVSLLTMTVLGGVHSLAGTTIEPDMDRGGSDYAGYNLPSPDPALCRKACDQDPKCKAYTYVKPGLQGPLARCYLKDPAPAARPNKCCVSGVKTAEPVLRAPTSNQLSVTQPGTGSTTEPSTDRPGLDYAGYDLPSPGPELCRKACDSDTKCKAYTYVKPDVQGPLARCYLKYQVPAAQANECCVSGVKTTTPTQRAAPPQSASGSTVLSPETRVGGVQPQRAYPAVFMYAQEDSADLEAHFKGRFRTYGLTYDWNQPGTVRVRFRWLKKSSKIASAQWQISAAPFAPVKAGGGAPVKVSQSLRRVPSGQWTKTPTLLEVGPASVAKPTGTLATPPGQAPTPLWAEFEIDLSRHRPLTLSGLVVDPVKTDKTVGGPDPNSIRPDLYIRVVLFGNDGKLLGAESNTIHVQFRKIDTGTLKVPEFRPTVSVHKTIPWGAFSWNYQCHAVYARDYEITGLGNTIVFSAKRGDKENLCKKHDTAWYEDVGSFIFDAFESLVAFVKDTVNWAATAYNDVKSAALDTIVSGLKGVTGCGGICQSVVSATLDTGLAMAGMPPSLPDFDELVANLEEGGIEDLATAMTDAAAAQGVPVGDIPGVKTAIKEQLSKLKDELKSEMTKKASGGAPPLKADLSKHYRPMTVVLKIRNANSGKSEESHICVSQSPQTPEAHRSMGFPRCVLLPALVPGGEIPVSIDIDAIDDPLAWEALLPTAADYASVIVNGLGTINAKTNAAKAARDAWTNKYVHSSHSFDVSIGAKRIGGLQCSKGGETCAMTP